jgi:two-component system response regulator NreC
MDKIAVLLADDHTLFRESLRSLLRDVECIEVVGEASDGAEAVTKTMQLKPDVVLMDVAMPNVDGLEATRQIKRQNPSAKILILTMYDTEQYIFEMIRAGASGYILKRAPSSELVSAIQTVSRGDAFLYPCVAKKVLNGFLGQLKAGADKEDHARLTDRERQILCLIAEGKANREIADLLGISIRTVKTHRLNLMEKLKVHDRAQLVRYAIREGLIVP